MITFIKSGLSNLTMERGRAVPYSPDEIEPNQLMELTESDNPIVVDYGSSLNFITLELTNLSKDQYDGSVNGLKTWFQSTEINWAANSFTMVDEFGVSNTVRWWQKTFSMPVFSNGRYSISFRLLKQ